MDFLQRFRVLGSAALGSLILVGTAMAEDQVAASPPSDAGELETVEVTANKRVEDIKDVPTSISVLGAGELDEKHVVDYDDLSRSIPGISFGAGATGSGAGEGLANIEIRGISSNTGSATVGVYLDETPITVRNQYDGSTQPILFDMDRVEVLRGPQGTLYGASSMGGTIRFIPKQADLDTTSAEVSTDLSGVRHGSVGYDETGVVNVPIIPDVFAIRAGLSYGDDSGWIDNYALDGTLNKSGINDVRHIVAKFSAKIRLSDDFSITPELLFQRVSSSDSPVFYPSLGLYKQNIEVTESGRDTVFIPSVVVKKSFDFADLTSVTSYFWRQFSRYTDGTYYNSDILATAFLDPAYPQFQPQNDSIIATLPSPVKFQTTYGQFSEEMRLSSNGPTNGPMAIRWVAGLYYADQWNTHRDREPILGVDNAFQSIYGFNIEDSAVGVPGQPNIWDNDVFYFSTSRYDERQYAAFGQADFDILPGLHGAVGLRYLFARVSYTNYNGGYIDLGNISPYVQLSRYYALTPKFSVTYDLNTASSIYSTVAKGFRLGGPTGPTPSAPGNPCSTDYANLGVVTPPTKYGSDSLWSYELGTKSRLLNNTLSVDGAVYYINWQQVQQTINLPICGFNFVSNVGDAESYGGEIEVRYKPPFVTGLTLGLTGGANHAVITSTTNAQTAAVGEKVLFSPDWTATLSAEYSWPITGDIAGFVRTDYDWVGRSHGSFVRTNPNYSDPQYDTLNASVGVDTGTIQASLYVKNLTNDQTIIQRPQVNTVITGYALQPLTIGVHVAAQF